jgi:hypothetical protein
MIMSPTPRREAIGSVAADGSKRAAHHKEARSELPHNGIGVLVFDQKAGL